MFNLNDVQPDDKRGDFQLIPNGTVCRVILKLQGGNHELAMYGRGNWFTFSKDTKAKWADVEFTIIGGQYDKRKFWDRIFVDGDKMTERNVPEAQEIGMRTIRAIVDSAKDLSISDMSEQAVNVRNSITGIGDLNGMELCVRIRIQKGTNGYEDKNVLSAPLTKDHKDYISGGQPAMAPPTQQPSVQQPQQAPQQGTNTSYAPSWANK